MSEGTNGAASGYGRLIEEVFIDPIRTVVVVDDEFPTLDALLDHELGVAVQPANSADDETPAIDDGSAERIDKSNSPSSTNAVPLDKESVVANGPTKFAEDEIPTLDDGSGEQVNETNSPSSANAAQLYKGPDVANGPTKPTEGEIATVDHGWGEKVSKTDHPSSAKDPKRAREIIKFCHHGERRWMVEIYDGKPPTPLVMENDAASHLHQSDLMILDYHLDEKRPNDGSDAIDILRRLADNDHFNLVVVYTKGFEDTTGDIPRVVREIAIGLSALDERLVMKESRLKAVKDSVEEWEDEEAGIAKRVLETIDDALYLRVRMLSPDEIPWKDVGHMPELEVLRSLLDSAPRSVKKRLKLNALIKWVMYERQQTLGEKLADSKYGLVDSKADTQTGTNWIRTDRLFITVVNKSNEPSTLSDMLLAALAHWNPEPHRLLMSKMRAVLDERGVLAEGAVLGNRCLHAGWLEEYLAENADERTWKIRNTIDRHWDGLGDAIRTDVSDFAERLADHLISEGRDTVVERWYSSLPHEEIRSHLNRYASSKPTVDAGHLMTGHVLHLQGVTGGKGLYWLCLSPACDLVPGRSGSGWPGRLGDHIPFIAAELVGVKREAALSNATGGNYLFLEVEGGLKCFSFTPPLVAKEGDAAARVPNPKWEQMFAANQGRITGAEATLRLMRVSEEDGKLRFEPTEARVVAQLRYEYALNLLQRLGGNLSRVGVDFVGMPTPRPSNGQADS